AEWHFDEGAGNVVEDSSGNGNDGVIYGATWVDSKYGKALQFDGVDDYVDCGTDSSLDVTGDDLTIEAWIYRDGTSTNPIIVTKGPEVQYTLYLYGSDYRVSFKIVNSAGTQTLENQAGTEIATGAWHHIAAIYSGSSGEIKIFIDGSIAASGSVSGGNIVSTSYPVTIGNTNDINNQRGFDGRIDQVRILNYAKTGFGGGVVINEVGFTGANKYIELYNNAGSTVNIGGWTFKNEDGPLLALDNDKSVSAGQTLKLEETTYPNLDNLDAADYVIAYDLDPDNNNIDENSEGYQCCVDFVAWGASPGTGDVNAVSAGLWTDNDFVSVGAGDSGVRLKDDGNNDEAKADWQAIPSWWNTDWNYRKKITITENSGSTLTNYQVKLDVTYDSDMQSDFDDLRFTDNSNTELSHWRESYTASSSAVFWVKVPSIPASTTTDIYMYYGNPSASSASDGDATFEFFDDFEGISLDSNKWTEDAVNNIDHTINNYFRFEGGTTSTWIYDGTDTGC
ncbi:MAG: DUF2341 domain-containing protein, partial [Thermoplasmata archaeon]|nr:DUF2341 domain-containing protein [Thermoplasmata archaeon]